MDDKMAGRVWKVTWFVIYVSVIMSILTLVLSCLMLVLRALDPEAPFEECFWTFIFFVALGSFAGAIQFKMDARMSERNG